MNEKVFMLTDGCAWEINKQAGNEHPHSVEVVDMETGAVRYIKSGAKISLLEGKITDIRTQAAYNKTMPRDPKDKPNGKTGKKSGKEVQ